MTIDKNIEIANLQHEIGSYIGLGQNSLVFHFDEGAQHTVLRLITANPRHNQSFLFHATEGDSKVEALRLMLEYVKRYKEQESSYTIQWSARGDNALQTSYFRARNIMEALDKLFYDRDPNSITVFSVMLNPIS